MNSSRGVSPMKSSRQGTSRSSQTAANVRSLNTIREICARAPLGMTADLLQDLTSYKTSRDKGVVNAARSLISLYRDVAPEMLLRKDRGKNVSMAMSAGQLGQKIQFGVERNVANGIQGLELLEAWKKEQGELDGEDNEEGTSVNWFA